MVKKMKRDPHVKQLLIILFSIVSVFIVSRFASFLVINGYAPSWFFAKVGSFRLHHFVYGNILILITSFLAIGVGVTKHKNWFALFYGIGLGLVLDEFLLWIGDVTQLTSIVLFIPGSLTAVTISVLIIASIIMYRLYWRV